MQHTQVQVMPFLLNGASDHDRITQFILFQKMIADQFT